MRRFGALGAILAFLGVAAGAFGAHGLKAMVTPDMVAVFQTGAHYQQLHSVAMVALAAMGSKLAVAHLVRAQLAFLIGILIFSGSLYALALSNIKVLGAITPIGGVAFLCGWLFVVAAFLADGKSESAA
ncbi:MAG: DUF423 domain-containing protein [Armatimonadetes bacterium]|nr:DUF423 domain-containing protein [Armatimonadota bacterium]